MMRHDEMRQGEGKLYALYAGIGHEAPLAVGPDGFPVLARDPLARAHEALSRYVSGLHAESVLAEEAALVVAGWRGELGELVAAACARVGWACDYALYGRHSRVAAFGEVVEQAARARVVCAGRWLGWALEVLGEARREVEPRRWLQALGRLVGWCVGARGLEREVVLGIGAALDGVMWRGAAQEEARGALERALEEIFEARFELDAPWAVMAQAELDELAAGPALTGPSSRAAWEALLEHLPRPKTKAPGARWWARTRELVAQVGEEALRQRLRRWLPQAIRHGVGGERNEACIRGLLWAAVVVEDETVAALVGELAETSWRAGGAHVPLGNVAAAALGQMGAAVAVGPLCRLKLKQRGAALHAVMRAFEAVAARAQTSVEELEEQGQPTMGLDGQGVMRAQLGGWVGEARVVEETLKVEVRWVRAASYGQVRLLFGVEERAAEEPRGQKAAPRAVREEHAAELAAFEIAAHELERELGAQRDRLEAMMLRPRRWAEARHRACYLEHPLVGLIARRQLWVVGDQVALWRRGRWEDVTGQALPEDEGRRVVLWHPAMSEEAEVLAWRKRLSALGVTQPVRQAWREVWRRPALDEGGDLVWSGRGAEGQRVVRQLHVAALGKARGWQVEVLPRRGLMGVLGRLELGDGLAAELWAQAVGYEVAARGIPAQATLVRVRVVEADGSAVRLDALGAGVVSEVLRDVACFVEVASARERMGA